MNLPPLTRGIPRHATIGQVAAVQQVVRLARRRTLLLACVASAVYLSSALLASFALALLLGTRLLDGRLFAAVTVVCLVFAALHIRRRWPSRYALAQELDLRCGLNDSLSTAWHLLNTPERSSSAVAQFQIRQAENAASRVDLRRAFPWSGRKNWLVPAGIALLCCAFLFARYRVSDSLDLKPSFLSLLLAAETSADDPASPERRLKQVVSKPQEQEPREKKASADAQPPKQRSLDDANSDGDGNQSGQTPAESAQGAGKQSVLQQMRDALSRLLDKVAHGGASASKGEQQQASARDGQQPQDPGRSQGQGNQEQASRDDAGKQQSGNQPGNSEAQAKARDGGPGMGNSTDAKPDAKGQGGSQSGAGNENGSQRLMTAEELKAMGKIADLVGKRSSEISGEMTITNSSGPQELSTDYSNRVGQHRNVESSISEEGVRPEDREYILHYMRAMHELTDKQARTGSK